MRGNFSKMVKIHQQVDRTERVQFLRVETEGKFVLKDGCELRIFPKDVGKTMVLRTNLNNQKVQSFAFYRVEY